LPLIILAYSSSAAAQENQVYVITGAHQDIGKIESLMQFSNQLKDHIELIETHPDVRFCMGNTYNLKHFLQVYPEYKDRLKSLMQQGKISSPAEWVDFEPQWYSGEYLVRSVAQAKYWLKSTLGYDTHWAHLNDVPSITPQFAQILEKSKVDLLVISGWCWKYPPDLGRMFNYKALDGSKILTYSSAYNGLLYLGSELRLDYLIDEIQLHRAFGPEKLKLGQAISDWGTEAHISLGLLENCRKWNKKYAEKYNFSLHFKTIEDFATEINKRITKQKIKLPETTGTVEPWPWAGQSGSAWTASYQRTVAERMLPTVEKLSSICEILGVSAYPTAEINRAWDHILWTSDHNWGWDKGKKKSNKAGYDIARQLLERKAKEFASAVKWEPKGIPIVVFNPLNWARSEVLEISVKLDEKTNWAIVEHSGKPVFFQELSSQNNGDGTKTVRLLFSATDVPSIGYKTFYVVAKDKIPPTTSTDLAAGDGYIENKHYRISADKTRGLVSIYDKLEKRELINSKSAYPFGFSVFTYSSMKNKAVHIKHIESQKGSLKAELRFRGKLLNYPVTIRILLWRNSPRIDIKTSIDYKGFRSTEEVKANVYLQGRVAKADFRDNDLVRRLLKQKIIEDDNEDADYAYFNATIKHKEQLINRLAEIGVSKIEPILAIWQETQAVKQQHHAFILPFKLPDYSMQLGIPYGSIPNLQPVIVSSTKLSRRSPSKPFIVGGIQGKKKGIFELSSWHKDIQKWFAMGNARYSIDVALIDISTRTYMLNDDRKLPAIHLLRWNGPRKYSWHLALRGHRGDWRDADTTRFGWECSNPLLAAIPSRKGSLPPEASFITIEAPAGNIVLSTFKQAFDGNGYVLRFYETEDQDTQVKLSVSPLLKIPRDEVSRTDLLENPIEALPTSAQSYSIPTLSYGIETLRFFKTAVTDVVNPATVTDLTLTNPTSTSFDLVWSAPGDDGKKGTAHKYQIRYSTKPINDQNWDKTTEVKRPPKPRTSGTKESLRVAALTPQTTYYFAIRAVDEAGNRSSISNIAQGATQKPDTTPPAPISDLSVTQASATTITLSWTTTGDDQYQGQASHYELRYSTDMIDITTWEDAHEVPNLPAPAHSGSKGKFTVKGLAPGETYYFAIKTIDEAANPSALSNVTSGQTGTFKQVVLQNGFKGYSGCEDTYISRVNEEESQMIYGRSQTIRNWAGETRSVLIKFNLSSIPVGANIHSATLKLYCYDITYGDAGNAQCYRLTADWDPSQANWWQRDSNHKWGPKGGGQIDQTTDYGFGPNGIIAKTQVKDGGAWVEFPVTKVIQHWLTGKYPNFGLLIKGNCNEDCGMYYHASEYQREPALRPVLEIKYDPVAPGK
jgi:hypothetical protein